MKICKACGEEKDLSEFHKKVGCAQDRDPRCKPCKKEYKNVYGWHRRVKYNLTKDQFDMLLANQGDRCILCGIEELPDGEYWHVDHDHRCCPGKKTCGKCIRGILCRECNWFIGYLEKILTRSEILEVDLKGYLDRRV